MKSLFCFTIRKLSQSVFPFSFFYPVGYSYPCALFNSFFVFIFVLLQWKKVKLIHYSVVSTIISFAYSYSCLVKEVVNSPHVSILEYFFSLKIVSSTREHRKRRSERIYFFRCGVAPWNFFTTLELHCIQLFRNTKSEFCLPFSLRGEIFNLLP